MAGFDPLADLSLAGPSAAPALLTITCTSAGGTIGAAFSLQPTVSGGTGPYTWVATGLPPGLSIDSATGLISGYPTTQGSYLINIRATDSLSVIGDATPQPTLTIQTYGMTPATLLTDTAFGPKAVHVRNSYGYGGHSATSLRVARTQQFVLLTDTGLKVARTQQFVVLLPIEVNSAPATSSIILEMLREDAGAFWRQPAPARFTTPEVPPQIDPQRVDSTVMQMLQEEADFVWRQPKSIQSAPRAEGTSYAPPGGGVIYGGAVPTAQYNTSYAPPAGGLVFGGATPSYINLGGLQIEQHSLYLVARDPGATLQVEQHGLYLIGTPRTVLEVEQHGVVIAAFSDTTLQVERHGIYVPAYGNAPLQVERHGIYVIGKRQYLLTEDSTESPDTTDILLIAQAPSFVIDTDEQPDSTEFTLIAQAPTLRLDADERPDSFVGTAYAFLPNDCRVLTIEAEDRSYQVCLETRTVSVAAELRLATVQPEPRVLTIPSESRTLVIECCDDACPCD